MKCLVINLDRSSDRLAHTTAEFARMGVAFERMAAIDARQRPDLQDMLLPAKRKAAMRLADAEIACLLSHRACWAVIAAGDDAHGAVFEDDLVFSEKAGALLADAGWIPADADIVKLETFFQRTKIALKRIAVGHGFSAGRLHGVHIASAAYVLSRQAAKALVDATMEIGFPVDHLMFNPALETSSSKVIYQLWPALCAQEQFIGQGTIKFPSLLKQDRQEQLALSGLRQRPRGSLYYKVGREVRRLSQQFADLCRLRQWAIVPFEYRGKRVRRPHTQHRENAL